MTRNNLKKARENAGISQRELGDYLNIATITVRSIENGKRDPSTKLAVKYANFFHRALDELFPDIFLLKFDTKRIKQTNIKEKVN